MIGTVASSEEDAMRLSNFVIRKMNRYVFYCLNVH